MRARKILLYCGGIVALCVWGIVVEKCTRPAPKKAYADLINKPICPKGMTCDASKYHTDPCNYYDYALSVDNCQTVPIQIIDARDPLIVALGKAIAREEGFGKPGTLATQLNNPGLLVWAGQPTGATVKGTDYAAFYDADAGWAALYADLKAKRGGCLPAYVDGWQQPCVEMIAYNWSQGDREKYSRDVVADLKAKGLLK